MKFALQEEDLKKVNGGTDQTPEDLVIEETFADLSYDAKNKAGGNKSIFGKGN